MNMNDINSKPTIVVDLDDTLVHVTPILPKDSDKSNYFTIVVKRRKLYVQMRPNLQTFLDKLSKLFNIYVFTASEKSYANKIIDKILPNVKNCCRFFKDSCINLYGYFVKDLEVIQTPLHQTLLLDDTAGSAIKNPKNLIKIKPWNGEKDDDILTSLLSVLENIAFSEDLRQSFIEIMKKEIYEGFGTF
ncbi:hypothetical protein M9Y10_020910 [Tritrichomonas musculus]|uniref:Mitochondrial import inner membrane translocase subunit TIM50 n=1 Tax=Tritrichomonas musculus TaxID=1915356 RepID=A0ABR2HH68_9EUKA